MLPLRGRPLRDRYVLRLIALDITDLYLVAGLAAAYAVLEGAEAVGLWLARRWAEYLMFISTAVFLPYEVYERAERAAGSGWEAIERATPGPYLARRQN